MSLSDLRTRTACLEEAEQTLEWWLDYQDRFGYATCWECNGQNCYWCGYGCQEEDNHGPWVIAWESDSPVCQKCLIPRSRIPTDLERLAALGERPGIYLLREIWPITVGQ